MSNAEARHHVPILHVYASYSRRGPAAIVGTRAALIALRDAIDQALVAGSAQFAAVSSDREEYAVGVECDDTERSGTTWPVRAVPYTAPYAEERRPHAIWPNVLST